MTTTITMGNDEFILYIRKRHADCTLTNDQLGKRIWMWLSERDPSASQIDAGARAPCLWGDSAQHLGKLMLPKTAAQISFERRLLPALYNYLDDLGHQ